MGRKLSLLSKLSLKVSQLLAIIFFLPTTHATTLLEAYEVAVAGDTIYRAAVHENAAGQQFEAIGRANLLPNISASYSYNRNNTDITTSGSPITRREDRDYNSKNGVIQLRQPVINMEGWARYQQGTAQTNLSNQQLAIRKQELITRFFALYAAANYAEDVLALSEVQYDGFKKQEEANQVMSVRGEGTKTALIESQAKLRLSEAQVIESKQELINAHNALFAMLGKEVGTLDRLSDNFNLLPLESVDLEVWKAQALQNNPEIAAQKEAVEVAKQEVKRNQAGHMPRLDAVASISQSDSDSVPTFQQELDTKSIGLQLNIPIYAGGSVSALTAQSQANYLKTQAELDSKVNEVLLDLRKQHSNLRSGILKIEALQQSVTAADLLITASKKSLIGGVRTNLDVLNARTQLFEAKRDLSLARYNYIISYINLRKSAGVLSPADLEKIATYFVSQPRILVEEDANYAMSK